MGFESIARGVTGLCVLDSASTAALKWAQIVRTLPSVMDITIERLIASVECPGCIIAEALHSRMHELYWVSSPWKKELGQCLGSCCEKGMDIRVHRDCHVNSPSVCHINRRVDIT